MTQDCCLACVFIYEAKSPVSPPPMFCVPLHTVLHLCFINFPIGIASHDVWHTSEFVGCNWIFIGISIRNVFTLALKFWLSSIQSVVSDSLWPHGLQHSRPPCALPTPRAYSNSCPLSRWGHPTISSSVVPFSSCLQSFPANFGWGKR